ncbi:MAG: guanylate kinase [Puniceicoccaceae bacterium]
MSPPPTPASLLLVIAGPAGSGKTTLCDALLNEFSEQVERLVTTTSRDPRPGEVDGNDYHFLSPDEFRSRIDQGKFIEWAYVHGRYYGSQKAHVLNVLTSGRDILLNIDVQGAEAFRKLEKSDPDLAGRVHTVFIKPESMEQIRERLDYRGSDDEAEIQRRLNTAEEEMKVADQFDHVIISGSREADYAAIRELYLSLKTQSASPGSRVPGLETELK